MNPCLCINYLRIIYFLELLIYLFYIVKINARSDDWYMFWKCDISLMIELLKCVPIFYYDYWMIKSTECELRQLYLWHANLFYNIYCLHIVIFVCMWCGLVSGAFNPRQIICYVWLDSHNYNCYVVRLFCVTSGFTA